MTRYSRTIDIQTGVETLVPYTAEEEAEADAAAEAEANAPPLVRSPTIYAVAQLGITPGDITGIDVNSRFSAALYLDVGSYLVFFAEPQADTSYLAKAYDDATKVRVTEKSTDYIAITVTDDNGDPVDPAEISVEIIRVS